MEKGRVVAKKSKTPAKKTRSTSAKTAASPKALKPRKRLARASTSLKRPPTPSVRQVPKKVGRDTYFLSALQVIAYKDGKFYHDFYARSVGRGDFSAEADRYHAMIKADHKNDHGEQLDNNGLEAFLRHLLIERLKKPSKSDIRKTDAFWKLVWSWMKAYLKKEGKPAPKKNGAIMASLSIQDDKRNLFHICTSYNVPPGDEDTRVAKLIELFGFLAASSVEDVLTS